MARTLKVQMTQADINNAPRDIMQPQYCWMCPVASALLRATNRSWYVTDGIASSYSDAMIVLPKDAIDLALAFDAWASGHGPKPTSIEFEVTLP
jgi:hypothetical protein